MQTLIEALLNHRLPAPGGTLTLTKSENYGAPSINRVARSIQQEQSHTLNFQLTGSGFCQGHYPSEEDLWKLRASNPPFFNIQDLVNQLGLGASYGFEIIALAPIAIANSSRIDGTVATVEINAAVGLDETKVHLGVTIHEKAGLPSRTHFESSQITWKPHTLNPLIKVGEIKFEVPKASLLHCYANFADRCYNTYWVSDPTTTQNHLRAIVEIFDAEFRKTRQKLDQGRGGSDAEGHENAVATMMWMLGFAPLNTSKLVEAPDIVGVSADGNILVVECTLGDLKTKRGNKMQNLLDRVKTINEALERANASFYKCIPVVVSSKSKEDILDDIEICEKQGIAVITKDDLDDFLSTTRSHPNSVQRYQELRNRIDEKMQKHAAEKRKTAELEKNVSELKRALSDTSYTTDIW